MRSAGLAAPQDRPRPHGGGAGRCSLCCSLVCSLVLFVLNTLPNTQPNTEPNVSPPVSTRQNDETPTETPAETRRETAPALSFYGLDALRQLCLLDVGLGVCWGVGAKAPQPPRFRPSGSHCCVCVAGISPRPPGAISPLWARVARAGRPPHVSAHSPLLHCVPALGRSGIATAERLCNRPRRHHFPSPFLDNFFTFAMLTASKNLTDYPGDNLSARSFFQTS
jgi:hypothetical protein